MSDQGDGKLYVVATPIGNIQDITLRALEILKNADWIAAEDTRHSRVLLQHHGISTPMISFHAHNERQRAQQLLNRLRQGETGALISDAGTPLISDPGGMLVRLLRREGVEVVPVPGPSALIAALSVSGLPAERFAFEGFPPAKSGARKRWLQARYPAPHTLIFYEAPHRLLETLEDMAVIWGEEHPAVVTRELTKQYESWVGETLGDVLAFFRTHPETVRGELVILLGPVADAETEWVHHQPLVEALQKQGLSDRAIVQVLAEGMGVRKNQAKRWLAQLKSGNESS